MVTSFKDLREEEELFDVTLACDDEQIQAHKVILSAGSSFFQSIIRRNPHTHPLIYLKGVKLHHLASLLDFMYLGITKVAQENVKEFLALGEELGVRGLTMSEKNLQDQNMLHHNIDQTKIFYDSYDQEEKVRLGEKVENNIKNERTETVKDSEDAREFTNTTESSILAENDVEEIEKLNAKLESLISKVESTEGTVSWECKECKKIANKKSNLKKHIEIHLGVTFSCKYCGNVFKTRNTLYSHMSSKCKKLIPSIQYIDKYYI